MRSPCLRFATCRLLLLTLIGAVAVGVAACNSGETTIALPIPPHTEHYLYVAVYGADRVDSFRIEPTDGTVTPAGPAAFVDAGPEGLAVHPTGRFVYVANNIANTLSGFAIDPPTGALTPIPGMPIPTDPNPISVAVHPNGQFAYVTTSAGIQAYQVDGATGLLFPVGGLAPAGFPWDIAIHPLGTYLYSGTGVSTIAAFSIDAASGVLAPLPGSPFPGASGDFRGTIVGPSGQTLYSNDDGNDNVYWFSINGLDGSLSAPSSVGVNATNATGIAMDPTGSHIYTASASPGAVGILDVQPDGSIVESAPAFVTAGSGTWRVTVAVAGQYVYSCASGGTAIHGFARDGITGDLNLLPGFPLGIGASSRGIATAVVHY